MKRVGFHSFTCRLGMTPSHLQGHQCRLLGAWRGTRGFGHLLFSLRDVRNSGASFCPLCSPDLSCGHCHTFREATFQACGDKCLREAVQLGGTASRLYGNFVPKLFSSSKHLITMHPDLTPNTNTERSEARPLGASQATAHAPPPPRRWGLG